MMSVWYYLSAPTPELLVHSALCFLRISIGLLTIGHGIPKITGGITTWASLGAAMGVVGIHFLPTVWGCLAACIEFFGGIGLLFGIGTRVASFFLTCMMAIAFATHYQKGDSFTIYSAALAHLIIYATFTIIGGGICSFDYYVVHR